MTAEDVAAIRAAGSRARALQALIDESLRRGLNVSANIAQRELRELEQSMKQFDVRLG